MLNSWRYSRYKGQGVTILHLKEAKFRILTGPTLYIGFSTPFKRTLRASHICASQACGTHLGAQLRLVRMRGGCDNPVCSWVDEVNPRSYLGHYSVHALADRTRSFLRTAFLLFLHFVQVLSIPYVLIRLLVKFERGFVSLHAEQMHSLGCGASEGCSLRRTARFRCRALSTMLKHVLHTRLRSSELCGSFAKLVAGKVFSQVRHSL